MSLFNVYIYDKIKGDSVIYITKISSALKSKANENILCLNDSIAVIVFLYRVTSTQFDNLSLHLQEFSMKHSFKYRRCEIPHWLCSPAVQT